MSRSISVVRRRTNLVDLTVGKRDNVQGYRFSVATNFNGSFSNFQTVPNSGFVSAGARGAVEAAMPGNTYKDKVRFAFAPSDYTPTYSALRDDTPFWVRIEPQTASGTYTLPESVHMIMPYDSGPLRGVIVAGIAPTGSVLTQSAEINLPQTCNDWEIQNMATGADLLIAFEAGSAAGPELRVKPLTSIKHSYTSVTRFYVRGDGTGVSFQSFFTIKSQQSNT